MNGPTPARQIPRRRRVVAPQRTDANSPAATREAKDTAQPASPVLAIPVLARLPHLHSAGEVRPRRDIAHGSTANNTAPGTPARKATEPASSSALAASKTDKPEPSESPVGAAPLAGPGQSGSPPVAEATAASGKSASPSHVTSTGQRSATTPRARSHVRHRRFESAGSVFPWLQKPGIKQLLSKIANGTLITLVVIVIVYLYAFPKRPASDGAAPNQPAPVGGDASDMPPDAILRQARREPVTFSQRPSESLPITQSPNTLGQPGPARPTTIGGEAGERSVSPPPLAPSIGNPGATTFGGYPATDPSTYRYPAGAVVDPPLPWAASSAGAAPSPYPTTNVPGDTLAAPPRTATLRGTIENTPLKVR